MNNKNKICQLHLPDIYSATFLKLSATHLEFWILLKRIPSKSKFNFCSVGNDRKWKMDLLGHLNKF